MIESSKITLEIIRENAFEHKKEKPGLSANRPSNNWTQYSVLMYWRESIVAGTLF